VPVFPAEGDTHLSVTTKAPGCEAGAVGPRALTGYTEEVIEWSSRAAPG
jgi:hypothetical protein